MPLLTQNQRLNAYLLDETKNIAAHQAASAQCANRIAETMLKLDDAALTDWLNSQSTDEPQPGAATLALFASHGQLGESINAALTLAGAVLSASGLPAPTNTVDVRSVADKLAAHGRVLGFTNSVFSVTTPAPPEPE